MVKLLLKLPTVLQWISIPPSPGRSYLLLTCLRVIFMINLSCCWKGPSYIIHLSMYSCRLPLVGLGACVATFLKLIMQQNTWHSLFQVVCGDISALFRAVWPWSLPHKNHNFCGTESSHGRLWTWWMSLQHMAGCPGLLLQPKVRSRVKPITLCPVHASIPGVSSVGPHTSPCSSALSCCTPWPQMRSGFVVLWKKISWTTWLSCFPLYPLQKTSLTPLVRLLTVHTKAQSQSLLRSQICSQPPFLSSLHSHYCRFLTYPLTTLVAKEQFMLGIKGCVCCLWDDCPAVG